MISLQNINDFFNRKSIAVVGVSTDRRKFGYSAFKELKDKGYSVIPVNPKLKEIEGTVCYPAISDIPGNIDSVLLVVQPDQTDIIVKEAFKLGIKRIWMQQGAESESAIKFCEENGIDVIHHQCVLMFADPVKGFHKFHKTICRIFRKLPS